MAARPPRPFGSSKWAIAAQDIWDWMYDSKRVLFRDTPDTKWDKNADGTHTLNIRPSKGGGAPGISGWFWNTPIELPAAPYPAVGKGAVIHLQSSHALVTTGIRDAANPTGPLVKSFAGSYIAMRDVPAQATVSGNPVWNLPQSPMPTPGNWDDASNFWRFWPDPTGCT